MAEPLKRLFTVTEYHSLAEAGILSEDDRVELIEGEIYRMAAIGSRHAAGVKRLNAIFSPRLAGGALLGVQDPICLSDFSEVQPDISVLRPRSDYYDSAHPTPGDVLLIVEVADTSIGFERRVKIPLYARTGVPEVWLVDLSKGIVEIHRQPSATGFRDVSKLRKGDSLSPLAFPELKLNVSDILG